jgi:hypothetical protein
MCVVGVVDDSKESAVWMGERDRQFLAGARHVVPVPGGVGDGLLIGPVFIAITPSD